MNVNLRIERLVLDGIALHRQEGGYVQAAVESELARLLTTNGVSEHFLSGEPQARLHAPAIDIAHRRSPALIGKQIASAVYDALGTNGVSTARQE